MTPMKRKKMRRANSRSEAFNVMPRIWSPLEWRESLKIPITFRQKENEKKTKERDDRVSGAENQVPCDNMHTDTHT